MQKFAQSPVTRAMTKFSTTKDIYIFFTVVLVQIVLFCSSNERGTKKKTPVKMSVGLGYMKGD